MTVPADGPHRPAHDGGDGRSILSIPVDAPPSSVRTEEDEPPAVEVPGPLVGPPGGSIFSLEHRPAPSLYLLGWLLSGIGLATIAVALLGGSPAVGPALAFGGILALGAGLALSAGYQLVARAGRPPAAYRGPSPLILFGIVLCLSTISSVAMAVLGQDPRSPSGFVLNLTAIGLLYLAVVWLFVVRGGALRWREMAWPGWRGQRPYGVVRLASDAGYALLLMLPTTLVALLGAGLLARLLETTPTRVLPDPGNATQSLMVIAGAAVIAPIGEELFFRGFALTAWLRDRGPRSALIRSSLFFALVHIANVEADTFGDGLAQAIVQFAAIVPVGVVIGILFLQRGMVAAIAGHVSYNGLLLALYFSLRSLAPAAP